MMVSIPHCNENLIYAFPEKELRNLSPTFNIHVSVDDILYIYRIGPHISLHQTYMQAHPGNKYVDRSQTQEYGIFVSNFRYCVFAVLHEIQYRQKAYYE